MGRLLKGRAKGGLGRVRVAQAKPLAEVLALPEPAGAAARVLREALIDLVNDGHYHLIIDVEGVEFLDSTGLGVLVGGLKRVRAHNGSLAVVCTQERLLKIFRITGLTKVFSIRESVDAALAAN